MSRIDEYVSRAAVADRERFLAGQQSAVLVLYLEEGDGKQEWSFKTDEISGRHVIARGGTTANGVALSKDASRYRVFELVKAPGSPWPHRISVGRASNNDIVLPHRSVSKLHAHFTRDDAGQLLVSDAGSRNGTRVNSERITGPLPRPVAPSDLVTFGAVSLTHLDAGGLYDLLRQLIG